MNSGPKITVIGAGSYFFGRCVIHKMATSPVMRGGTLALVDTSPRVLRTMSALARRIFKATRCGVRVETATDRRRVMEGSDFVILTFSMRNACYRGVDTRIAAKHGIKMCSSDTIGPGGIFRALREVPHVLAMARDAHRLAPHSWVINLVNPTTVMGITLRRYAPEVKSFALCDGHHEPYNTVHWCKEVGILPKNAKEVPVSVHQKLDLAIGGVNHTTWIVRFRYDGRDMLPVWRRKLVDLVREEAKKPHDHSKARYNWDYALQLFDLYGAYPTAIGHTKEYVPFFQGYGVKLVKPEPITTFDGESRAREMAEAWKVTEQYASGKLGTAQFIKKTHDDHATDIIESMWGGLGKSFYINSPNRGAITNFPANAFVELRSDVDMHGPRPQPFGAFPRGLLAHQHQILDTHELTAEAAVTGERAILRRAMLTDPICNNIGDADACIAELLAAEREVLPSYWFKKNSRSHLMQTFSSHVDSYQDASDQFVHDLRRRAEAYFRRQGKEKAALKSIKSFEAHRARVRRNFMDAIGGLPTKKTPLKAHITGRTEREKFVVERIIYESQPNFPVTAACYVPKGLTKRTPAVVFVCGHWDMGKMQETYQSVCIDLANNGFIVLAVDPVGQGERSQFFEHGQRTVGSAVLEHTHAGLQFVLQGASIARHFIWDVMRGIDYLETRPDVDPKRIGITGNSGGGTQTSLLMLSEPRIAAAVPCTFIMTLESYMKTGQAQDSEQIVRNCCVVGPDHDDILTAIAPRPVLVGAVAYDFFPIEGSIEAVRRAKRIFSLYGKPDNVDILIDKSTHAYTSRLREACVNWFRKHLLGEKPDFKMGKIDLIPERELWATKSGQVVVDFPKAKTIFDLNFDLLSPRSPVPSPSSLRRTIDEVLGVSQGGDRRAKIYPRIIGDTIVDGYRTEKLFFHGAPDITVTALMVHPRGADSHTPLPTTLLLLDGGTNDAVRERPRIESLLRAGQRVFVFDVRGVGGVKMRQIGSYEDGPYPMFGTEYKLGCDASMLGISTLGLRVFDVLRGYDYLKTRKDVGAIHVHGVRRGSILGYFAAALEDGFASVTTEDMLISYRHLCETRDYDWMQYGYQWFAWGILRHFDLPDLLACLRGRFVTFVNPRNAFGEPMKRTEFQRVFLNVAKAKGCLRGGWRPKVIAG